MQTLTIILLAVWLILVGLMPVANLELPYLDLIAQLLAIAVGGLLLVGSRRIKLGGRAAILTLAGYLILSGLLPLLSTNDPTAGLILSALAIVSGVLLLAKR